MEFMGCMVNVRNCQTVFEGGCTILQSHQPHPKTEGDNDTYFIVLFAGII